MEDIVFTLELDGGGANERSNNYLKKGWKLLHVGQKAFKVLENGQIYYSTVYVVGANNNVYDNWKKDQENSKQLEKEISDFLSSSDEKE